MWECVFHLTNVRPESRLVWRGNIISNPPILSKEEKNERAIERRIQGLCVCYPAALTLFAEGSNPTLNFSITNMSLLGMENCCKQKVSYLPSGVRIQKRSTKVQNCKTLCIKTSTLSWELSSWQGHWLWKRRWHSFCLQLSSFNKKNLKIITKSLIKAFVHVWQAAKWLGKHN